ncbi:MAG TPA: hypothetical protein PKC38_01680 [Chitinophagales bacterium]|nr:hypothetical protein [Chitinophagales bacterium]HNE44582.1 hypothetical protein [Chitinophagales bacterium]HNM28946.1 hypothetical protein [Chitinophagales bacterium]
MHIRALQPVNQYITLQRISAIALILCCFSATAQINCENDTSFHIPIVDLQTDYFGVHQGGLYPDGLNTMPAAHADSGIAIAESLLPINYDGQEDTSYGKFVFLGLGNEAAGKIFNKFITQHDDLGLGDSCMRIVNACMEEYTLHDMYGADASDAYWNDVNDYLQSQNLKKKQVRAVWLMTTNYDDTLITEDAYIDSVKNTYIEVIRKMKKQLPNLSLLYISGLPYGGYADTMFDGHEFFEEPIPYLNDFAIKAVIDAQINGDTSLIYSGEDADAPWIAWGPNVWADGRNLRAYDNLRWLCPGDYASGDNGIMLSGTGQTKVADRLYTFLTSEPTTLPWIYGLPYDCFTEPDFVEPEDSVIVPEDEILWITQNPVKGVIKFVVNVETNDKAQIYVFDMIGNQIVEGVFNKIEPGRVLSVNVTQNARGLYILSVFVENKVYNKVFYLDN